MVDMYDLMDRVIKKLDDGDGHFVLAVGNNDDWIAYISKDEDPDGMFDYGTGNTAEEALEDLYEVL